MGSSVWTHIPFVKRVEENNKQKRETKVVINNRAFESILGVFERVTKRNEG